MRTPESANKTDPTKEAGEALQAFTEGPARDAAEALSESFARAGNRISQELGRAARTGEFSFRNMVDSILKDLARVAINDVIGGAIGGLFNGVVGGAAGRAFGGARAEGGPVSPGGAFLVGERGPEVFRPNSAGNIENNVSQPGVVVNFNLGDGADVESFRRSQGQISALLARAVENGRKRL